MPCEMKENNDWLDEDYDWLTNVDLGKLLELVEQSFLLMNFLLQQISTI